MRGKVGRYSLVGVLGGALLMLGGFGCKGLSSSQQAATKPVNLEFWTVFDDVDEMQRLVEQYRAQRSFLKVNIRQLRPEEVYPRLVEALSEDHGPDILSISNRWLGKFQSKLSPMPPAVKDVTAYPQQSSLGTTMVFNETTNPTMTPDQIDREYVQSVRDDVVRGNDIYGLPLSLDTMAIYYNKDILDRAGVAEPPKTWAEFQAAVKKVTKFDKSSSKVIQSGVTLGTGNNIPGSDDILAILFKQSGIDMVDRSGQAVFNYSPPGTRNSETPVVTVLNFYTDFANPDRDTYSWNETMDNALDSFIAGKVGFFFGYSYHNAIIKARAPQLNYRILPMLQLNPDHPVNVANYWIETVPTKSTHKDEAWGLINFLAHSTATKEYLTKTGRPTALRAYLADQQAQGDLGPFASQALVASNWYHGKDYEAAVKALNDMLHEWLVPPPVNNAGQPGDVNLWRHDVLDRATLRVNQTL